MQHRQRLAYAKSNDPGLPTAFGVRKDPSIRAVPATFRVRNIRRIRRYREPSAHAKSVGAGLLANAVSQATNALRQDRLRGQARSYRSSLQHRQLSVYAKSDDPGRPTAFGVRKNRRSGRPATGDLSRTQNPANTADLGRTQKSVGAGLLANAVSQATNALRQGLHAVVGARLPAKAVSQATDASWEDRLSRASAPTTYRGCRF